MNSFVNHKVKPSSTGGFTLIEIAIAMMVVGMILIPALQIYDIWLKQKVTAETNNNQRVVHSALGKYVARYGAYPLPADPSIPLNDMGSGQSVVGPVATACTAVITDVCVTNTNSVDTTADADVVADNVLIGDIPYATLGIPYQAILDGYGYKMKYAVTQRLTATGTFNNGHGAIEVLNDGRDAARTSAYGAAGAARGHYVIVSHGADNKGAFSPGGTIPQPCGLVTDGRDFENCNNDGRFRNNVYQFDAVVTNIPTNKVQIFSAPGALHFDDYVLHTPTMASGIWTFVPSQPSMISTQNGNVQIGTPPTGCTGNQCLPIAKVNVNGDVRVEGNLKTTRLCSRGAPTDAGAANCLESMTAFNPWGWMRPDIIGGTPSSEALGAGILCQSNKGLQGINGFDEVCSSNATVFVANPALAGPMCDPSGAGTYPRGVTAAGQIICE